jgi:hypothetical protein
LTPVVILSKPSDATLDKERSPTGRLPFESVITDAREVEASHVLECRARAASATGQLNSGRPRMIADAGREQITLDSSSTGTENVEALAPLIRSIQDTDAEQIYLRSLDKLVEEKEKEISKVVEDNYEVSQRCLVR